MRLGLRLTRWDWFLLAIIGVALVVAVIRYATGIGSIANINNAYPWGWWVGYGIMTTIALGGVGFTITLLVEVFGRHRYHSFLRPAVLMAMLLYISAITMLMVELGRPWKVWMILISWAPTSALYEVGWCAFLYLNVLMFEFAQVPLKEGGWHRALAVTRTIYIPLMLLGVTLSHLHQSSLGSLLALVPHKVHALWWSPNLAWLFLVSAIMAGPAVAILEHIAAARWLRFTPRMDLLAGLARIEVWLLGGYGTFKLVDLFYRGAGGAMFEWSWITLSFWAELMIGVVVPFAMLLQPEMRTSRRGLAVATGMIAVGILLNRLNVAVIGLRVRHWESYFPSAGEVIITLGITAAIVFVFGALVRLLPIHEEYTPAGATPQDAHDFRPAPVTP
jgi:Ni/Fe-hydrogenase subunit HybB-like protein